MTQANMFKILTYIFITMGNVGCFIIGINCGLIWGLVAWLSGVFFGVSGITQAFEGVVRGKL